MVLILSGSHPASSVTMPAKQKKIACDAQQDAGWGAEKTGDGAALGMPRKRSVSSAPLNLPCSENPQTKPLNLKP